LDAEPIMRIETPAFIYDEAQILHDAGRAASMVRDGSTNLLFAMKAFSLPGGLEQIATQVDGFAVSSLFEAQLARRVQGSRGTVHLTTPGLRADELSQLADLCDYISFNSLPQWRRFHNRLEGRASCGLRINPELSFVQDPRYDPCRAASKLGVPLSQLRDLLEQNPETLAGIAGLHIHSNCDSPDLSQLLQTVKRLEAATGDLLGRLEWLNLGGGYLFDRPKHPEALMQAKELLNAKYNLQLFIEPGAAIVRRAGSLVASVVDLFSSGEHQIAVLDTSVNHMPEVFEYQFEPDVAGDREGGTYTYLLAGSSCLAGDLFGIYRFDQPLEIGSQVVFENMGAYSLVKANWFNGINLPNIYARTPSGELVLHKRFGLTDFLTHCGVERHAGL
jgi:carboxynorspermidine decarboxylase